MSTLGMIGVLLLLGAEPADGTASASRLAVIDKAPNFTLTNQAGAELRLADLKGKVILVSFVFTTCSGSCPATTHRMSLMQQELKRAGLLKNDEVALLSITLDPVRDTPEVLRRYAQLYDVETASWSFVTGPPAQVARTIAAWGMWARPAANGQLDHPSRIFLVDRQGNIREIYNLDFFQKQWVLEDVRLLLGER